MAKELNGVTLPVHFNGIGTHDTPGASTAVWGYAESAEHAQQLREHGVTLYKILGDGANKVERCRAYVDNGIVPIVRPYIETPWGRGLPVTPGDQLRPYIDAGVRLVELGNEWNIACEWVVPIPNAAGIAQEVCNWWEVCLQRATEVPGLVPLFPSNTPGGNVDHRLCYAAIIAELARRGLLGTVKHVAVHPRPHNNPPDVRWSATNTVTFDEWRWIRDQFEAAGASAYYWATEHGYSVGDDQNHSYPQITLDLWLAYNQELQLRMNPAHAQAIEPELAGHTHWFEAGWGHWGAWAKDSLRDSIVPEMPAPSPLWTWMPTAPLGFSRYNDTPVPPVLDPNAPGIDVSQWQGVISWPQVAAAGMEFAMIRASVCRPDGTVVKDPFFDANWAGAKAAGLLRGAYHYLHQSASGQAAFFVNTVGADRPELGYWADLEDGSLTADKCQAFLEATDRNAGETCGVYTRASFFDQFDAPAWAAGRKLWVADWTGGPQPLLPAAWDEWEFWQHSSRGTVPGIAGFVDLDRYKGEPEPPIGGDVRYFGPDGVEHDEAWWKAIYGEGAKVQAGTGNLRIVELHDSGEPVGMDFQVYVRGDAGGAAPVLYWPDGYVALEWKGSYWDGLVFACYAPPDVGPYWLTFGDGDQLRDFGWLCATAHRHPKQIVYQAGSAPATYSLDVDVVGGGSVIVAPAGPYAPGAVVTLTADPDPGWLFAGWQGDLTGTANPALVVMDRDKAVTGVFVEETPAPGCPVEEIEAELVKIEAAVAAVRSLLYAA